MTYDATQVFMLESMRDEGLDSDLEWRRVGSRKQKCEGCARPPLGYYPQPLESVVQYRQRATLSIDSTAVDIFKRDLFDLLHPYMPGMIPGEVRYPDGRVLRESVTVHFPPEPEIVMRGARGSRERDAYRRCPVCDRVGSSRGVLTRPWYILRSEIPQVICFEQARTCCSFLSGWPRSST
jgi:hypothetical protein